MNTKMLKKSAALITGTLVAGSFSVSANANQANLFEYENLGSGAELRSELIEMNSARYKTFEMKCGGDSDKNSKTSEANCGAGDKKAEKSDSTKKAKSAEAKCGEGKCGGDTKEAKKDTTKKESKAAQSKCGQGKCGVE
ncbi:MAG: hypothetical protein K9J27_08630 [Bacteroidales bacterium]|nr:hypothetical protein [Bacteroidales bacterium]MCF8334675.1 hypothetical protein [Bacteroidales bacterium]